jgi:hypothetical protein
MRNIIKEAIEQLNTEQNKNNNFVNIGRKEIKQKVLEIIFKEMEEIGM